MDEKSYDECCEFFDNNLYKEFCKRGCKILCFNREKNDPLKQIPMTLKEYYYNVGFFGYVLTKINTKKNNESSDIIGVKAIRHDFFDQGGKINKIYFFQSVRILPEFKHFYNFSLSTEPIEIDQTELLDKNKTFYDKINIIVNYIYSLDLSIPSYEDLNNYRNNLYPCIYEKCLGSKIVYYKYVSDMYVYPEIKKYILDIMLRIDRWDKLNFYCVTKNKITKKLNFLCVGLF